MAPHDRRLPFKRAAISDQQRRRELTLQRQAQSRRDAQQQARCLASTVLSFQSQNTQSEQEPYIESKPQSELLIDQQLGEDEHGDSSKDMDISRASKLQGTEARKWFAKQLMLPEWMIDVPDCLSQDWYFPQLLNIFLFLSNLSRNLTVIAFSRYVFARPAGKRCFVVSSNGTTVSRQRNGSILHRFPSALPNGAKTRGVSGPSQSYCILDCIFHEVQGLNYKVAL